MYSKDKTTIIDRREMLRVKLKSLAEEARIIRKEEQRTFGQLQNELHLHRVKELRFEARATHVAYGLIKGRTLAQIEPIRYKGWPTYAAEAADKKLFERVAAMIKKYGPANFDLVAAVHGEQRKAA